MIIFAGICPHPPIIIPEIGGENIKKTLKTIAAMKELAYKLIVAKPDVIIIISPHGVLFSRQMSVIGIKNLFGDFAQFGAPQVNFKITGNPELAAEIVNKANEEKIPSILISKELPHYELDHGILVPFFYLIPSLQNFSVIPIGYSSLGKKEHFRFGEAIAAISEERLANSDQRTATRIAIIASGDLSHCLQPGAPAGYNPKGQEFDQKIVEMLAKNDIQGILSMREDFIEEAAECGYRSILILLGAIAKLKYKPKILSYEAPFGVGYLVANFEISS